jgi:hypothetical protein
VLLASLVVVGLMGHDPQRALFPDPPDAAECDYLSPCRCPVDLQKFNPLYPRSLHRMLSQKDKTCGHGNHGKL